MGSEMCIRDRPPQLQGLGGDTPTIGPRRRRVAQDALQLGREASSLDRAHVPNPHRNAECPGIQGSDAGALRGALGDQTPKYSSA